MTGVYLSTNRKLKDETPVSVKKCGFMKLRRRYEYQFTSVTRLSEALDKNRSVRIGQVHVAGIIRGNA
jgi:hypothetical protein